MHQIYLFPPCSSRDAPCQYKGLKLSQDSSFGNSGHLPERSGAFRHFLRRSSVYRKENHSEFNNYLFEDTSLLLFIAPVQALPALQQVHVLHGVPATSPSG